MSTTTKDFDPIRADYTFFEDHSTEAAADVAAYLPQIRSLLTTIPRVRMLDFGCGPGRFTQRLLTELRLPADRLQLSLVEPVEAYRQLAASLLQPFSGTPVEAAASLRSDSQQQFDLILSNHVLYYVPNLDEILAAIYRSLDPAGLFIAAVAGQDNTLIQFWNSGYAMIGLKVPFHTAEDVSASLHRLKIPHETQKVTYDLNFPDGEENRLKILRFLMGQHFHQMPRQSLLDLFAPFAANGQIAMRIVHDHFHVFGKSAKTG